MNMFRAFALMALALIAAPAFGADGSDPSDPPSIIGRLNYISGQVSFAPGEANNEWRAAPLNRPLTTGDRLWVDNGGRAELHVGSNSVRLAEQTSVDVLAIDDRLVQFGLAQGTLHINLRRPPEGGVFEVAAPHGAVHLTEPGIYRIAVNPSGSSTTVVVRAGHAEILTGASRFAVRANSQVVIPAARVEIVAAARLDEFDRWAEGRDQKRARIAAARYVPPDMTGYEDLDEHGSWRTVATYGTVWVPSRVPAGWAPFRDGHWVWISPWGWTWVDDAPWGFAPAHYGRWVWVDRHWAWAPGPVNVRPVYAPAVVAFIGGSNFSISIGARSAPAVAWVPLGWREPYIPWYRVSPTYVRNVNVAHVRDINVTNIYNIINRRTTVTNIRYVNRDVPSAVTVTSRDVFVNARRVEPARVAAQTIRSAPVVSAAPVAAPERTSFSLAKPGNKPPPSVATREVIAATPPPTRVRDERTAARKDDREKVVAKDEEQRPRVRVLSRDTTQPSAAGDAKPQAERAKGMERDEKSAQKAPEREQKSAQPQEGVDPKAPSQQAERDKGSGREDKAAQQKGQERDQKSQQAERRGPAPGEKPAPQRAEGKGPAGEKPTPQQAERKGPTPGEKPAPQQAEGKGPAGEKPAPQQAERKGPTPGGKPAPQQAEGKGPTGEKPTPQQVERKGTTPGEKPAPQQAEGKGPTGEKPSPQQAERKGPTPGGKPAPQQAEGKGPAGEKPVPQQAERKGPPTGEKERAQEAQRPVPPPAAGGERPPGKVEREDRGKKKSEREAD